MNQVNLFAPQWQGSGVTKELYDGAQALYSRIITKYGRAFHNTAVDADSIPELENGILGYRVILPQLLDIQNVFESLCPDNTFLLGGGCGIEIPVVSGHLKRDRDLAVFWFDAHGDLNSPETSLSHHFHGMPLRYLTEDIFLHKDLDIRRTDPSKIMLLGTRDLDSPEQSFIEDHGIQVKRPDSLPLDPSSDILPEARRCYIHIDLDVLDPDEFRNVKCPVKKGITIKDLLTSLRVIRESYDIAGISILENTEQDAGRLAALDSLLDFCFGENQQ